MRESTRLRISSSLRRRTYLDTFSCVTQRKGTDTRFSTACATAPTSARQAASRRARNHHQPTQRIAPTGPYDQTGIGAWTKGAAQGAPGSREPAARSSARRRSERAYRSLMLATSALVVWLETHGKLSWPPRPEDIISTSSNTRCVAAAQASQLRLAAALTRARISPNLLAHGLGSRPPSNSRQHVGSEPHRRARAHTGNRDLAQKRSRILIQPDRAPGSSRACVPRGILARTARGSS